MEAGVIVPSKSPWASPVVLVRKKDCSVRWCIDYRKVNDVTIKDAYPLPKISQCLDCLSASNWFSSLDLQSGYWQIKLEERDRQKTAFITKYGLYEYTKMPFGLCNAGSTFQRCMELIFRGLQWKSLIIYIDDIIIFSRDEETHFQRLEEALMRLGQAGLRLKPSKCELVKNELLFLGHVVNKDGIQPNPATIEAVKKWDPPRNVKQVQQFLGLCNYYRSFVKNFSEIASPISRLTSKKVKFEWSTEYQAAFINLKEKLCETPILAYPSTNGTFILDTDASNVGIGGVLSKKLDKPQQNYSVTRRELLAIVTFVHQFRHYLLGKEFMVRTDHSALRWLKAFKDPQGQLARWLEVLAQYHFLIQHREGRKHCNADSLSRKDMTDAVCHHYKTGVNPHDLECKGCTDCVELHHMWSEFNKEVDTVGHLSQINFTSIRAITRSMDKTVDQQTDTPLKSCQWLGSYTAKQIEQVQREDNDLKYIHQWMDENKIPDRDGVNGLSAAVKKLWLNWPNLKRHDGMLFQHWITDQNTGKFTKQLLVPMVLRREVLINCHDRVTSAHLGVRKTTDKIKQRFYWYQCKTDVQLHIMHCGMCTRNSEPRKKYRAPLGRYQAGCPLDRVGIDILGPLPQTKDGNIYILVVADYFTRWVEAYPLPDQKADTVAKEVVHQFISRLGAPLEIHTDQGRNFESHLFRVVCRILQFWCSRGTPSSTKNLKFHGTGR